MGQSWYEWYNMSHVPLHFCKKTRFMLLFWDGFMWRCDRGIMLGYGVVFTLWWSDIYAGDDISDNKELEWG